MLPFVSNPSPNTFCFTLLANSTCAASASNCCKNGDVSSFVLNANAACDRAAVTATLNNVPITGVSISNPPGSPAKARILSVPNLALDTDSIGPDGAQLCLTLPSTGTCTTFSKLAVGGNNAWSASLVSSDSKCCPVSRGRPAPAAPADSCHTCFVWDVLGSKGTQQSSAVDFFSRNSCELVLLNPADYDYENCCQYAATHLASDFDEYRAQGIILSGFDRAVCNRTSLRLCGILANSTAGHAMIKEMMDDGFAGMIMEEPYNIMDDRCPIALIDSTIRFYSATPGSAARDTKCAPLILSEANRCSKPDRNLSIPHVNGKTPFPNQRCNSTQGITPFYVEPYMDVLFGNGTDLYCIKLGTTTPINPMSSCGNSTTIDSVSFWLYEPEEGYESDYLGLYLHILNGTEYVSTPLNYTWGAPTDNAMIVRDLGLSVSSVASLKPKICFERPRYLNLGVDSVDILNFLWTALFDTSGTCCPTYYSNTY